MCTSHEAAKGAALASRQRRVQGCRLAIRVLVSVTQGANRVEDSARCVHLCPKQNAAPISSTVHGGGKWRLVLGVAMIAIRPVLMAHMLLQAVSVCRRDDCGERK